RDRQYHRLRQDCGGTHFVWRPRSDHGGSAAGSGPANPGSLNSVLRLRGRQAMVEIARVFPQRGRKRERRTGPAAVIAAWIGTTLLAVLAGGIFGLQIETIAEQPKREQDEVNTSRPVTPAPAYSESGRIRALPPVVTKLAGERDAWVRIEASIVLA